MRYGCGACWPPPSLCWDIHSEVQICVLVLTMPTILPAQAPVGARPGLYRPPLLIQLFMVGAQSVREQHGLAPAKGLLPWDPH